MGTTTNKGLFIVFEGIDGSGTSTQSENLQQRFIQHQQHSILTAEPSNGPIGTMIRQILKGRITMPSEKFEEQMAYLFAADRHDHLYNTVDGVEHFLQQGKHVICTRYIFSSIAYHAENPALHALVSDLNQRFPLPDIVIYLEQDPSISMQRIAHRSHMDVYENQEKLLRVAQHYQNIWQNYTGTLFRYPATTPISTLSERIWADVSTHVASTN